MKNVFWTPDILCNFHLPALFRVGLSIPHLRTIVASRSDTYRSLYRCHPPAAAQSVSSHPASRWSHLAVVLWTHDRVHRFHRYCSLHRNCSCLDRSKNQLVKASRNYYKFYKYHPFTGFLWAGTARSRIPYHPETAAYLVDSTGTCHLLWGILSSCR